MPHTSTVRRTSRPPIRRSRRSAGPGRSGQDPQDGLGAPTPAKAQAGVGQEPAPHPAPPRFGVDIQRQDLSPVAPVIGARRSGPRPPRGDEPAQVAVEHSHHRHRRVRVVAPEAVAAQAVLRPEAVEVRVGEQPGTPPATSGRGRRPPPRRPRVGRGAASARGYFPSRGRSFVGRIDCKSHLSRRDERYRSTLGWGGPSLGEAMAIGGDGHAEGGIGVALGALVLSTLASLFAPPGLVQRPGLLRRFPEPGRRHRPGQPPRRGGGGDHELHQPGVVGRHRRLPAARHVAAPLSQRRHVAHRARPRRRRRPTSTCTSSWRRASSPPASPTPSSASDGSGRRPTSPGACRTRPRRSTSRPSTTS